MKKERNSREHDAYLRRQALQIATQLPEDKQDAHAILRYMTQLVDEFLSPEGDRPRLTTVAKFPPK